MERFFGPTAAPLSATKPPSADGFAKDDGIRRVHVPLEDLLKSYVVSYGKLLGHHPETDEHALMENDGSNGEEEASCSEDEGDLGSEEDHHGPDDPTPMDIENELKKKDERSDGDKTKKKKKKAKRREAGAGAVGDYDFNDPFIDDDEVAVAYESIFDLMNQEDYHSEDGMEAEARDEKPPLKEFYVYRGEMQVEVVSKLKNAKQQPSSKRTKSKKSKNNESDESPVEKRQRKQKGEGESKKKKKSDAGEKKNKNKNQTFKSADKEPKELSTLERILNLEAKLEEEIKSSPTPSGVNQHQNSSVESAKGTPEKIRKPAMDYDRLFAELECKLALKSWQEAAQVIPKESFDPAKFPSALRDLTGNLAICYLRAASPNHDNIEDGIFEQLSQVVPYNGAALRKVTYKRILPYYLDVIRPNLEKLYTLFNGAFEYMTIVEPNPASQTDPAASRKLKLTDSQKESLYDIVRFELDLVYIEHSLKVYEAAEQNLPAPSKLPGEMVLRKSIYQKIYKNIPSQASSLTSTNDLSLNYGAHKRKFERKVLKEHGIEPEHQQQTTGEKRKAQPATALSNVIRNEPPPPEPEAKKPTIDHAEVPPAALLPELLFPSNE